MNHLFFHLLCFSYSYRSTALQIMLSIFLYYFISITCLYEIPEGSVFTFKTYRDVRALSNVTLLNVNKTLSPVVSHRVLHEERKTMERSESCAAFPVRKIAGKLKFDQYSFVS